MTTVGELLNVLIGWLGHLIRWLISFIPRYQIIHCNQLGVKYVRGKYPTSLAPGLHWYWPWQTEIRVYFTARDSLFVSSASLETKDGIQCQVGAVMSFQIVDVLKYEVENLEANENMAEAAQGALRNIVIGHTWAELSTSAEEGSRLEGKMSRRMQEVMNPFGVKVHSVRPTDQIRLTSALRVFGASISVNNQVPLTENAS